MILYIYIYHIYFIAVMEAMFRTLKGRWDSLNKKRKDLYYGMVIDSAAVPLINLRYADDVMLVASSQSDVINMIDDVVKAADN